MAEERLQKIIARSGLCSRRDADRLVSEGRVRVDGRVAEPGEKVEWSKVHIKVDGKALKAPEVARYFLLYKPREVMTTCDDPEGRKTVLDLVRSVVRERVYPVGRLDYHSEGLLLLTNDGELAARVAHPRHGVVREYMVKIRGDLTRPEYDKLMMGTNIDGRHVKPRLAQREKMGRGGATTWWRIEVTEGRTHEVRELFFRAGHHVQRLRRTAIGPLRDDTLKPGEFRTLSENELTTLRRVTEPTKKSKPGRPQRSNPRLGGRRKTTERKSSPKKR
jgi:23S rRNA pseudouridine2605 synthase